MPSCSTWDIWFTTRSIETYFFLKVFWTRMVYREHRCLEKRFNIVETCIEGKQQGLGKGFSITELGAKREHQGLEKRFNIVKIGIKREHQRLEKRFNITKHALRKGSYIINIHKKMHCEGNALASLIVHPTSYIWLCNKNTNNLTSMFFLKWGLVLTTTMTFVSNSYGEN